MFDFSDQSEVLDSFRMDYEEDGDTRALLMAFDYAVELDTEIPRWALVDLAEKLRHVLALSRFDGDPFVLGDTVSETLGLRFDGLVAGRDRLEFIVRLLVDRYAALIEATEGWRPSHARVMAEIRVRMVDEDSGENA